MNIDQLLDVLQSDYEFHDDGAQNFEDIKRWLVRENMSRHEMKHFHDLIKKHYTNKKLPVVETFIGIWNRNRSSVKAHQYAGVEEVIGRFNDINTRIIDGLSISHDDRDFLAFYSDFMYAVDVVKSYPDMTIEQREAYIRKMKETVDAGQKIKIDALERFRVAV